MSFQAEKGVIRWKVLFRLTIRRAIETSWRSRTIFCT